MKAGLFLVILGVIPFITFASELPLPEYKNISSGVWYGEVKEKSPPVIYHVIKVDLSSNKVAVRPIRPREDETLVQMVARLEAEKLSLLGAITGDYFHYIREYKVVTPWGVLIKDGKLLFSPSGKSALCAAASGAFNISVHNLPVI